MAPDVTCWIPGRNVRIMERLARFLKTGRTAESDRDTLGIRSLQPGPMEGKDGWPVE